MKRWTNEEEAFLKENYKSMYFCDIAKELNKTTLAIKRKANRMRLITGRKGKPKNFNLPIDKTGDKNPNWKGGISSNNYRYAKRTKKKHPEKHKAGMKFRYAVRRGKILRPTYCSKCWKYSKRIEGHHEDYSKPLDVIWLCRSCHVKIHKQKREPVAQSEQSSGLLIHRSQV